MLYSFLKIKLRIDFLHKSLPFTANLIFELSTSVMTALSNPFMTGQNKQFHM